MITNILYDDVFSENYFQLTRVRNLLLDTLILERSDDTGNRIKDPDRCAISALASIYLECLIASIYLECLIASIYLECLIASIYLECLIASIYLECLRRHHVSKKRNSYYFIDLQF